MNCTTRDTIFFPSGFIPFTGIYSISAPLRNGHRRILGQSYPSARAVVEGIPLPTPTSLFFYGPVELAPGRIFNNVYIPSAEDRAGDYSQCGYIIDPLVGVPFAGGYISQGRLFVLYAFRIGVPSAAVPEPSSFTLVAAAIGLATVFFAANLPQNLSRTATMANSR